MRKTALLVAILLAATATQALAEKIDNPEYLSWKPFKPGAMVKIEQVNKVAGTETKTLTTHTLKELTDEKAVLSSQTTILVMGNEIKQPAEAREIPAKFDKPEVPEGAQKPDVKTEKGEETLTVGGQEVVCKWVKTTLKVSGNTTVVKVWQSDAVPGGQVKMESTIEGRMKVESRMTVLEFKAE